MALTKNATIESKKMQFFYKNYTKNSVFFDIETTGLNWRSSHVYLIGAAYFFDEAWHIRQWFLEKPFEEKELLEEFSDFISGFERVIHFNGNSFDIPYLQHKYSFYQCHEPFSEKESIDYYRILKPWKNFLGLSSMKQKDVESYMKVQRKDSFSGGELIPLYQKYLSNGDNEILKLLYLHNLEDVTGMISLLPMLSYPHLLELDYEDLKSAWTENGLTLSFRLTVPVPQRIQLSDLHYSLSISSDEMVIDIYAVHTDMKHYFEDYKNYYYLPVEDTVMHKSIAAYVDSEYKEKAKASNCYQRTKGFFLPQPCICFEPAFYADAKNGDAYYLFSEENEQSILNCHEYIAAIVKHFM